MSTKIFIGTGDANLIFLIIPVLYFLKIRENGRFFKALINFFYH